MKQRKTRLVTASLSSILLCFQSYSFASGFRLPEYTAAGVATSNALVADSERLGAMAYNPAIMSVYQKKDGSKYNGLFSGNLVHVNYKTEVTTSSTTSQGTGKSDFDIPNLFVSNNISDKLSIGLLIHSPFGLETAWPASTFPSFLGSAALDPNLSRIKMFNANFNFGYKLSANTGIAFGINQYHLLDLQFNTYSNIIKGTGSGYGWNIAAISKQDKLTLGASYRSEVKTRATGTLNGSTPLEVDITFPMMLQAGIKYQFNDRFKLEFDAEYTGWSAYDNLNIHAQNTASTVISFSTNNWKNTMTYRLGGQYNMGKQQLLFGYAYDESPQGDDYYTARIPDSDRQLFSLGYQYDFGSYQFEAGIMRVVFDDRTINSSRSYTIGGDPNGTVAYNGTYRADATIYSLGISTTF